MMGVWRGGGGGGVPKPGLVASAGWNFLPCNSRLPPAVTLHGPEESFARKLRYTL